MTEIFTGELNHNFHEMYHDKVLINISRGSCRMCSPVISSSKVASTEKIKLCQSICNVVLLKILDCLLHNMCDHDFKYKTVLLKRTFKFYYYIQQKSKPKLLLLGQKSYLLSTKGLKDKITTHRCPSS
ncbi:hypothetical protein KUTeg_007549 [Tegillarca granosa]|uniref:Uncharacterized protein n=1 Tax=Tegillarca granosa TaxID=220873 RepID=A0ABQ9FDK0_TEGGR|nr:hypothetical protein KUTeg_007549 [Tegillarca granosa]